MSAEVGLRGEDAGRNSSGAASVTPAAGGKMMAEERGTLALSGEEALQGSEAVSGAREGAHKAADDAPMYAVELLAGQGLQEKAPSASE